MPNLSNNSNIFVDLSQSAYNNRPDNFPYDKLDKEYKTEIDKGNSVLIDYNEGGKVYLQPDPTLKTTDEGAKGLLTDSEAGYNSYFVTDTPNLDRSTKDVYFVTRGSDSMANIDSLIDDWIVNDANFALNDVYIPQAKIATVAMIEKIEEMKTNAKNAKMNVTAHSLGTMVSIQAVANLSEGYVDSIGRVVLFQGPDARSSIDKMGAEAKANIEKLEAQGKIDYYVNAFDIVSMLNRNQKGVDEIGNVHYILPANLAYTSTFYMDNSSHDFGMYEFNPDGTIKEATFEENPEIFIAGIKLSKLIRETIDELKETFHLSEEEALRVLQSAGEKTGKFASLVADFAYQYNKIISEANSSKQTEVRISSLKSSIKSSSGAKKISLRTDLVTVVSAKAKVLADEYKMILDNELTETEDEIDAVVQDVQQGAYLIQNALPIWEVDNMIQNYQKDDFWDSGEKASIQKKAKTFRDKLIDFADTLHVVSMGIEDYDTKAGGELFKNELKIQGRIK